MENSIIIQIFHLTLTNLVTKEEGSTPVSPIGRYIYIYKLHIAHFGIVHLLSLNKSLKKYSFCGGPVAHFEECNK